MPGKRPRPFISTSIRPPAGPNRGYDHEISPASPEAAKRCLGVPQRVVVGFDVGENGVKESSSKCYAQSCRSPRSVLETDALSDQEHPPVRSLRSVLDRLLSRPASQPLSKVAVSSSSKAATSSSSVAGIRGEEPVPTVFELDIVVEEKAMAVSGKIVAAGIQDNFLPKDVLTSTPSSSVRKNILKNFTSSLEELEVQQDEQAVAAAQASIFCAGSPFSQYQSQLSVGDFLSVCFLCKCSLMPGKDIFMYRGDRAFCSSECRYQQIVIDELKERQPTSGNCFPESSVQDSGHLSTAAPRRWF